ncbi:unnamed protein product [Somion occarium]|uniref:Uncharacterized protein n=1 Tax=Somion occarium TaxID=3059160 RepID=A0ABP1E8D1_9APHY
MPDVQPGDIFILCYSRLTNGDPFHYAIAISKDEVNFRIFQAINPSIAYWEYNTKDSKVVSSGTLSCACKIGNLGHSGKSLLDVDALLSSIPHRAPKEYGGRKTVYNCVVWAKLAVRKLRDEGIIRLMLDDVGEVLTEAHTMALEGKASRGSPWKMSRYAQ